METKKQFVRIIGIALMLSVITPAHGETLAKENLPTELCSRECDRVSEEKTKEFESNPANNENLRQNFTLLFDSPQGRDANDPSYPKATFVRLYKIGNLNPNKVAKDWDTLVKKHKIFLKKLTNASKDQRESLFAEYIILIRALTKLMLKGMCELDKCTSPTYRKIVEQEIIGLGGAFPEW